jgi:hypothetical protein
MATRTAGAFAAFATRADTVATNLLSIADRRCPVFGPQGETLAATLRELANALAQGGQKLSTFQATVRQNADDQDGASSSAEDGTYYGGVLGDSIWDEIIGGFQIVGGVYEIVGGAALCKTGIGAILGVPVILHGIDSIIAGGNTVLSPDDEVKKTWTEENLGKEVDIALSLVGGIAGAAKLTGIAMRGAREGGAAVARRGSQEIAKREAKNRVPEALVSGDLPLVDTELREWLGDGPFGGGPVANPATDIGPLGEKFQPGVYEGGHQYGTFREDQPIAEWLADEGASVHSRVRAKGIEGVPNPDAMVRFSDADPGSISEFKTAMRGVMEQDDALRGANINTMSGQVISAGEQLSHYKGGRLLVYDGRTVDLTAEQAQAIWEDAVRRTTTEGNNAYGKALPEKTIFILGDNRGYRVSR